MLKAENITKKFNNITVLDNVNITLEKGEMVSLVGSSGAGKSSLLHILGSLDSPDSGKVWFNNTDIGKLSTNQLAQFRNAHMGFIFQFHQLLPEFTALENVCIPGWIGGHKKNEVEERAATLLKDLGLDDRLTHKPTALSGGEQQRVAVARALINEPAIVFADEPTGNLDSTNAKELYRIFKNLNQKTGTAFLIVTHNEELAAFADRTIKMQDGQLLKG
ncbi:MAG: ABC transporter ATP-binding protein [Sediminibacterium sp.]|jgi:lipoprotein-releasing system ATP-binding protein|nr:ABC transporter ATP-binding protein [Chitinophagaceae bacterium]MCA6446766.1 ABC transporter ATP-binding protein [Chitinophagaceae bacterium]